MIIQIKVSAYLNISWSNCYVDLYKKLLVINTNQLLFFTFLSAKKIILLKLKDKEYILQYNYNGIKIAIFN